MKNPDFSQSDLLAYEVDVDLNVFGLPMLNRVGRHVDGRHIVIVDKSSSRERFVKLPK